MDDIDCTDINGVEASCRVVPIEHLESRECVECHDVGDLHIEIWRRKCPKVFYLYFAVQDGTPVMQTYTTVASARRAMYKIAWDFSPAKRETLPRSNFAVL